MDGCIELSDIQLPPCEVTFTESIGEGMLKFQTMHLYTVVKLSHIHVND